MSYYWIKLYHEIIDDPKMAILPDRLWRRCIEIFLLAGKHGKNGELPETKQLAWELRMSTDDLDFDMKQLESTGIIRRSGNGWIVNNFAKRQEKVDDAERQRQHRNKANKKQCNDAETFQLPTCHDVVTKCDTELDIESESDKETKVFIPSTLPNSVVSVFTKVTGMFSIPGSEVDKVIPAMEIFLNNMTPDECVIYLKPYFEGWCKKRTKDGRYYSKTNCAWLYDNAMARMEEVVTGTRNTDGSLNL